MKKKLSKVDVDMSKIRNVGVVTRNEILKREEEEKNKKIYFLQESLSGISFDKLANNLSSERDIPYKPYLLNLGFLLNKLKEEDGRDVSIESLKVKKDVIEQLDKMKKYPPLDTICHIESNDVNKNSRFRYWFMKRFFRRRKYKVIFHYKNVDLEDRYYIQDLSNIDAVLTVILFMSIIISLALFIVVGKCTNIIYIICCLVSLLAFILMLVIRW